MNTKQIQILEDQASLYASLQTTDPDEWEFIFRKKFAEMLVSECVDVINDGVLNSDGSGDWYAGYLAGATECRRKIKLHFGVE